MATPTPALQASSGLPGAPAFDPALAARLEAAEREARARPGGASPHTRHLNADGSPRYTNRLALESSPYLQQHAHNPVNWYPWGDEAFATARRLGRPVLLSVGYSTCHWCHVMEDESFEDEEIARFLNENYVAIKVDREERPDVDDAYMRAVLALTGSGGWPMNVWLTPDREPFFGGSYFPPRDGDRGVQTGLLTLLQNIAAAYRADPTRIAGAASQLTQAIRGGTAGAAASEELPDGSVEQRAVDSAKRTFDPTWGGSAGAPKFPSGVPIRLLLRNHRRTGDPQGLTMATLTLDKMAAGGMHDQVGGGFHRYSTDRRWLVPHFEKMLYDNALLAIAYLEGYQATGREDFASVARGILRYVERDMTSPDGAFYSATDADSPGPDGRREEGRFFTWTPAEIDAVLGPERGRVVSAYFGVTPVGTIDGRSILSTPRPLAEVAAEHGMSADELRATVDTAREALYAARAKRPPPPRDEKIIAAWNGLMISAFARAALVLGDPSYAERATRAADFVLTHLRRDGRLLRSERDGRASGDGYLDDYAFLIAGLLDLDEATGDPRWLREAIALDRVLAEHYEDPAEGGFFLTGDGQESLFGREKPSRDGAEPAGNSVELLNLLRLAELTGDDRYRQRAERALASFAARLQRSPESLGDMLLALDFRLDAPKEIVIVTPGSRADAAPFLDQLRTAFVPNRTLTVVSEGAPLAERARLVPLVEEKVARDGKTTAYVCERGVCALPTTSPETFAHQIAAVHQSPAAPAGAGTSPSR